MATLLRLLVIFTAAALWGCTFVHGFTQMSERYCAAHPDASDWRCWHGSKP